MKTGVLIGLAALTLAAAPAALAQESAEPGVVAVRYFKCAGADVGEAAEMLNGDFRPIANQLIDEGKLLDYGILTHYWGDDWNLVDYFVAEDLESFHAAFGEAVERAQEDDPEGKRFEKFSSLCPDHKDNIYSVVNPPAEEETKAGGS